MKDPYLQDNGTLRNNLGISDDHKLSLAEDANVAKFAGAAGKQFMCIVDNKDVLIGWRSDLPDSLPRIDEVINFVGRGNLPD